MAKTLVTIILILLFTLAVIPAQQSQLDERITVEVDAVNVLVSVTDKNSGKFITNLDRTRFKVYEDGIPQEITNFSQQTNLPLTIAMCLDTSSSVKLKLKFEIAAALDFLYTIMRPTDRALLAEFDTGVTLLHDFTSNPNDLVEEIKRLKAGGGTSLYDAIYLVSEQKLLYEAGRKTMIILSDGADLTSVHSFEDALRMAQFSEAAIYAVSTTRFGANIDHEGDNALKQLADNTGGRVFFPYSTDELSKSFAKIEEELRSQYNLAYKPKNTRKDGTFRAIKLEVDKGDIRVRHRKGYYAPTDGRERFALP
jgi:VWFA-related protein